MINQCIEIIEREYGIPKSFFENYGLTIRGKKLWIYEKTLEDFERFWVSKGLVAFRISKIGDNIILKPTTNFIQLFGKEFKKKIYELDNWEEVKLFVDGKDLEVNENCNLKGYVVVKYEEHYLGCGRIEGKTLRNLVPKDRRIIIDEFRDTQI